MQQKYLLVDKNVLPEVFLKVVDAKKLIASGKAKSLSEAAKTVGISRSALYKYKDSIFTCDSKIVDNIATFYATLEDRMGVLSALISELYKAGANILTVNQNIPVDGVASVSVSARIDELTIEEDELIARLKAVDGIVEVKYITSR